MSSSPTLEDLHLVEAITRLGSVGAAARELLVSQPSASQRLAALERRIGTSLFVRDTTGARPTPAGRSFADQAAHVMGHVDVIVDRTLAAAQGETLTVGSFPSLAGPILTILDRSLRGTAVLQPSVEHGNRLIDDVAEGSLDAAFVAIATQVPLPDGVRATRIGVDPLRSLWPDGLEPSSARRPFAGHDVVICTFDLRGEELRRKLAAQGATPIGPMVGEAAIHIARDRRCPAILPHSLSHWYRRPDDVTHDAPSGASPILSMVSRSPVPEKLLGTLPDIRRALRLDVTPQRQRRPHQESHP